MKKSNSFRLNFLFGVLTVLLFGQVLFAQEKNPISKQDVQAAEALMGVSFSNAQRDSMLPDLEDNLGSYKKLRELDLQNSVPPALLFNPVPVGMQFEKEQYPLEWGTPRNEKVPENFEELAFYSVRDLAELIRTRKITSTELTKMYLARLKKYDPQLKCVITLTGHPCVVLPNGFNEQGSPTSISFIGRLYDEGTLLAVAKKYQEATSFNLKHPPMFQ